ncbi:MAG: 1,2-phenylacetyl-CoA epoxidase subunit PaaC [Beijerinckiaceae bacterium]
MTDKPLFTYTLRLADTALVLGHRLSEWTGHGPTLEEDIALSNLGLDMIGQARLLYDYAGQREAKGRDEDALAYMRDADAFQNLLLVEQPNGDFAMTIVRHFFYAAFAAPFHEALAVSQDSVLAGVGQKAAKEMVYHLRHSGEWLIRLGDGTDESRQRAQAAVDALWPYIDELFEVDEADQELIDMGIAPDVRMLRDGFDATLDFVLREATLVRPAKARQISGGRHGRHSQHLVDMLADMQSLHRAHPGVVW